MSDQDKNTEKLRSILQKKMAEAHAAESGWNTPSGDVWTGISNELQAGREPNRSKGLLYLFGAISVALVAVLLMRECAHSREVESLKSKNLGLESSYLELKESCNQNSNKSLLIEEPSQGSLDKILPVPEKAPEKDSNISPSDQLKNPESEEKLPPSSNEPTSGLFDKRSQNLVAPSIPFFNLSGNLISNNIFEELLEMPSASSPLDLFDPIDALSISPIVIDEPNVELNISKKEKSNQGLVLVPSLRAAFSLTGNRLEGEVPSIISNQKALPAYRRGVGLEAVLSRHISIEAGLEFSTYRIQTDYALDVEFTHENEYQHEDGGIDNAYNHSLPSAMGNYPAQFVLTRADDAIIHEGELMNLDLSIRQRTRFLSVPLHVRYAFGKSRLRAGVRLGVVGNHLVDVSSEMPSLVSNHSEIHQRQTSVGDPTTENLENNTLDVSLGLDLRYHLTSRIGVSLESNYQRGITPIYKGETVKNYLDAANVGVGLHFLF